MKAILMSISPEWLVKILNGQKTVEIRKTAPSEDKLPISVYLYCTKGNGTRRFNLLKDKCDEFHLGWEYTSKGHENVNDIVSRPFNGKVVAKFELYCVYDIYPLFPEECMTAEILQKACVTERQALDYSMGMKLKAWFIRDLEIFDKPMFLSDFYECGKPIRKYDGAETLARSIGLLPPLPEDKTEYADHPCVPQSWRYVEVPI